MSKGLRFGFWCLALLASMISAAPALSQQSPLDKLNRKDIPEVERAAWLPDEVVAVLGTHRGRHWRGLRGLVSSPDGKSLLSWDAGGLRLWETATLRELGFVHPRKDLVTDLALAPDGRTVAICGLRGIGKPFLRLLEITQKGFWPGAEMFDVTDFGPMTFSADGRTLAALTEENLVYWDVSKFPRTLATVSKKELYPSQGIRGGEVIAPGGGIIAFWSQGPPENKGGDGPTTLRAKLWDVGKRTATDLVLPCRGRVRALSLSANAKALAVLVEARPVHFLEIWDRTTQPPKLRTEKKLTVSVFDVRLQMSPDGKWLSLHHQEFIGLNKKVNWMVKVFQEEKGQLEELGSSLALNDLTPGIAFLPGGRVMLALQYGSAVVPWDLTEKDPRPAMVSGGHRGWVHGVCFTPDGTGLVSGGRDERVRLWRLDQGKPVETTSLEQGSTAFRLVFPPKGQLLLSMGIYPVNVRLWDFPSGRLREELKAEASPSGTPAAVFSPDGKTLYIGSGPEAIPEKEEGKTEDTLRVWDVSGPQAKEKAVVREHPTALLGLAVSPDGKRLATAGGRQVRNARGETIKGFGDLRLWDVTGPVPKEVNRLEGHDGRVYGVAFAPDGKLLASVGSDKRVRLWDVSGSKPKSVTVLGAHAAPVYSVAFSPDGKLLVSADGNGGIVIWDHARKAVKIDWQLPGRVFQVAFSPDNRHLATANVNGTVYIFRLPMEAKK